MPRSPATDVLRCARMNPVSILPAYSAGCAPLVTRAARSRLRHAFQHFRTPSVPSIVVRFASHPAREDDAVFRRKSFTCVQRSLRPTLSRLPRHPAPFSWRCLAVTATDSDVPCRAHGLIRGFQGPHQSVGSTTLLWRRRGRDHACQDGSPARRLRPTGSLPRTSEIGLIHIVRHEVANGSFSG